MSGHSKWSTIKRKKGKADAARGKLFTKLIKEITVAAREGGGDLDSNPRLRTAVQIAKENSMPNDNIERAIKKGTGDLEGASFEDASYEGYGPGGVAVMVEALTDNKNRTVAEIRHLFSRFNGNLGENGCVAWIFDKIGMVQVEKARIPEDDLMEIVLEAGATDMTTEDDLYEITTPPEALESVRSALEARSIPILMAEVTMLPQNTIKLDGKQAEQMLKLYEAFDEHDDVQRVYANFDIDEKTMEQLSN